MLFVWYFWIIISHLDWRINRLKYEFWIKCIHNHCFVFWKWFIFIQQYIVPQWFIIVSYFSFCVCALFQLSQTVSVFTIRLLLLACFGLCNTFFSDGIIFRCLNTFMYPLKALLLIYLQIVMGESLICAQIHMHHCLKICRKKRNCSLDLLMYHKLFSDILLHVYKTDNMESLLFWYYIFLVGICIFYINISCTFWYNNNIQ